MAEKFRRKSTQRSKLARVLLSRNADEGSLFSRLTPMDIMLGFGVAFLVTWLLVGFQFQGLIRHQNIPDYNIGDIADRDIVAPYDFTVEDQEATFQRQDNTRKIVPAIFDLDLAVNNRVEIELRNAFRDARQIIFEEGNLNSGQLNSCLLYTSDAADE